MACNDVWNLWMGPHSLSVCVYLPMNFFGHIFTNELNSKMILDTHHPTLFSERSKPSTLLELTANSAS